MGTTHHLAFGKRAIASLHSTPMTSRSSDQASKPCEPIMLQQIDLYLVQNLNSCQATNYRGQRHTAVHNGQIDTGPALGKANNRVPIFRQRPPAKRHAIEVDSSECRQEARRFLQDPFPRLPRVVVAPCPFKSSAYDDTTIDLLLHVRTLGQDDAIDQP